MGGSYNGRLLERREVFPFDWSEEGDLSSAPWVVVVAELGAGQGKGRVGQPSSVAGAQRSIPSLKKQVKYYQLLIMCSSSMKIIHVELGRCLATYCCRYQLWQDSSLLATLEMAKTMF